MFGILRTQFTMSTTELKEQLINKIRQTEDAGLLEEISMLIEMQESDEVYELNAGQKEAIDKAQQESLQGKVGKTNLKRLKSVLVKQMNGISFQISLMKKKEHETFHKLCVIEGNIEPPTHTLSTPNRKYFPLLYLKHARAF